jgi:large subunit ribosomal protein L11
MEKPNLRLVLYIRSNSAKSGPPLGTTLGNIGVNTVKFCKEFNEFTKDLPNYFLLKVTILISENKNFTFSVDLPSIGFIISLLKKEETIKDINGNIYVISYILLEDFLKLAKFKFPNYDLRKATKIIRGSLLSSKIIIKL